MERRLLWVGLVLLVILLVAAAAVSLLGGSRSLHGFAFDRPQPAPAIALTDQRGTAFSLDDQRGRVVLLYFGYTTCPEECPLTLARLKQVRLLLGEQAVQTQVVLVTTDPETDTPEQLGRYLSAFDPSYLGLTGSAGALRAAYDAYGVTVLDQGETHSTRVYLIDPAGRLRATYPFEFEPQDMADDIQIILKER